MPRASTFRPELVKTWSEDTFQVPPGSGEMTESVTVTINNPSTHRATLPVSGRQLALGRSDNRPLIRHYSAPTDTARKLSNMPTKPRATGSSPVRRASLTKLPRGFWEHRAPHCRTSKRSPIRSRAEQASACLLGRPLEGSRQLPVILRRQPRGALRRRSR